MTRPDDQEIDIARNLRTIEWLKSELVEGVSFFFKALIRNSEDLITEALAAIILTCYFLSKRLGIGYSRLDKRVEEKLRSNLETNHQLEEWYGDLSSCLKYFHGKNQD
jgi:hypothetical protein